MVIIYPILSHLKFNYNTPTSTYFLIRCLTLYKWFICRSTVHDVSSSIWIFWLDNFCCDNFNPEIFWISWVWFEFINYYSSLIISSIADWGMLYETPGGRYPIYVCWIGTSPASWRSCNCLYPWSSSHVIWYSPRCSIKACWHISDSITCHCRSLCIIAMLF